MAIRAVGNTHTFDHAGPIWLPANRLTRRIGERLESEEILYYFRNITIDGENVVNKGQQRFRIRPDDVWQFNCCCYSVRLCSRRHVPFSYRTEGSSLPTPTAIRKNFTSTPRMQTFQFPHWHTVRTQPELLASADRRLPPLSIYHGIKVWSFLCSVISTLASLWVFRSWSSWPFSSSGGLAGSRFCAIRPNIENWSFKVRSGMSHLGGKSVHFAAVGLVAICGLN